MPSKANKTVRQSADRKVTGMKPQPSRAACPSTQVTPPRGAKATSVSRQVEQRSTSCPID
jgi:hypothetical protein